MNHSINRTHVERYAREKLLQKNVRMIKRHLLSYKVHICIVFKVFVEFDHVGVVLICTKETDKASTCGKKSNRLNEYKLKVSW